MNIEIQAEKRNLGKKSNLNELRQNGFIPGIVYGAGQEGIKIAINARDFARQFRKSIGSISFFDITVDGKTYKTFIKQRQINPLTREIVHLDFLELHEGKNITIDVPINFKGEAPGTKEGGVLEIIHRKLQISCLPKDIPEEIRVDVSELNIGDTVHFSDLKLSKNIVTELTDETTIVGVSLPTIMEEPEEEEEELLEGEEGLEKVEGEEGEKTTDEESSEKDSE